MGNEHSSITSNDADPLGFGLKSVPEPLQRWWLIGRGNPYFLADVEIAREETGIPVTGFLDLETYVDWAATRGKIHGHIDSLPHHLIIDGVPLDSQEKSFRYFSKNLTWPIENFVPEPPCCDTDPVYFAAGTLALRYGIDLAEEEPGFQRVDAVVAGYIISGQWPQRRSFRGFETIYETDVLVNSDTGKRFRERYSRQELGIDSRGGAGRMLPAQYGWWKERKGGDSVSVIANHHSEDEEPLDERTIRRGINKVEKLVRPLTI